MVFVAKDKILKSKNQNFGKLESILLSETASLCLNIVLMIMMVI